MLKFMLLNDKKFKLFMIENEFCLTTANKFATSKFMTLEKVHDNNLTVLDMCIEENKYEQVKWIVEKSTLLKKNILNKHHTLQKVFKYSSREIFDLLLTHDDFKNINITDRDGRTILQNAVLFGRDDLIDSIVNHESFDISILDRRNRNVIFDAVNFGNMDMLEKILSIKDIDLSIIDIDSNSIFDSHITLDNEDIAIKLIEHGAKPDNLNKEGNNFISLLALEGKLSSKILSSLKANEISLEFRLKNGNPLIVELIEAYYKGSLYIKNFNDIIFKTISNLISYGANINQFNTKKESALFTAVRNQDLEALDFLIRCGINLNSKNLFGETALSTAILSGQCNIKIVNALMDGGANPTIKNNNEKCSLELLNLSILKANGVENINEPRMKEILSSNRNYNVILKKILSNKDFHYDYLDSFGNPLIKTPFYHNEFTVCKYYINNGVPVDLKNSKGNTLFYEYVIDTFNANKFSSSFKTSLYFLISNKADYKILNSKGQNVFNYVSLNSNTNVRLFSSLVEATRFQYNSVDNMGRTILNSCIWSDNVELLKFIIGSNIEIISQTDNFNILPITYAALTGNQTIAILLLKKNPVITGGKSVPKAVKLKFQPMLKNVSKLIENMEDKDMMTKLKNVAEQVIKDFT